MDTVGSPRITGTSIQLTTLHAAYGKEHKCLLKNAAYIYIFEYFTVSLQLHVAKYNDSLYKVLPRELIVSRDREVTTSHKNKTYIKQ